MKKPTPNEFEAWDHYAAGALAAMCGAREAAQLADALLEERRERYKLEPEIQPRNKPPPTSIPGPGPRRGERLGNPDWDQKKERAF